MTPAELNALNKAALCLECGVPIKHKNYCSPAHHSHFRTRRKKLRAKCAFCESQSRARGLCTKHYQRAIAAEMGRWP